MRQPAGKMPAFRISMSSPPKARTPCSSAPVELRFVGHVADEAEIIRAAVKTGDGGIDVEPDDRRAARQQRIHAGLADAGGGAGHQRDFAGEHRRLAAALELGLFQVPVLDVENVLRRQRLLAAERVARWMISMVCA